MLAALLGPLDYMFGETLNVAITVALLLAVAFAVIARFNEWSFNRAARNWLWVTSLVAIWLFTQHSPFEGHGRVLDLSPFTEVKAARFSEHRRDLVLANIALFAPLGAAAAWRGYRFLRTFVLALVISVAAEALQYFGDQGRIAQIDDVLLNVLGALCGWIAFAVGRVALEGERRVPREVERRPG